MADHTIATKAAEPKPAESVEVSNDRSQVNVQSSTESAPATHVHYSNMMSLLGGLNQCVNNIDDPTRRNLIKEHMQKVLEKRGLRHKTPKWVDFLGFVRRISKEQAERWMEYDEASLRYFRGKDWEADADHEAVIQKLIAERKAEEMSGVEGKSRVEK